jgi:pimeloyl-ACP methyl ester carboxylesterase
MSKLCWMMLAGGLTVVLVSCGGDGSGGEDTGTDLETDAVPDGETDPADDVEPEVETDAPGDPVEEFDPAACDSFAAGLVTDFDVDGTPRAFYLDLPAGADTDGPWAVVFNWHGMGDTAPNMRLLMSGHVDSPTMPFILVTPEDTNVALLGLTVDWWVHSVDGSTNIEARLFDEVLACLDHLYGVDRDHVHSVGMSMGGFVTDMLGTVRGEVVASLVTYSGAYGCNSENTTGSMLGEIVDWPEHSVTNTYTQLFLHGGTSDTYSLVLESLHFDQYARNDVAFLNARGHDAIICDHGGGHTVPTSFMGDKVLEFFAAHPREGAPSPWASGLPSSYPTYCSFSPAD